MRLIARLEGILLANHHFWIIQAPVCRGPRGRVGHLTGVVLDFKRSLHGFLKFYVSLIK